MFGKYRILSELGSGSFGTVYLSRHQQLECYRAIKLIPKHSDLPVSLLSEVQILRSIHHPGIPTIYDIEEDSDYYYIIEEYAQGESLDQFLLHQSKISQELFFKISLQLCDIFQYLHAITPQPVLYIDLKPEHIIVCGNSVKLIDFNVATFLSNPGNSFNLFGNEGYSAPELFLGALPNPSCDIYSLGKIMQFLSGFVETPLPPNTHQIIYKAAQADPDGRFETVDHLVSALNLAFNKPKQPHLRKSIVLFGSHPGCGVTHIAISLVSALNAMGFSATYFEKNNSDALRKMLPYLPTATESHGLITHRFFQGYPHYGPGVSLEPDPDSICVYDFGDSPPIEFPEADLLLYVCTPDPWHRQDVLEKGDSLQMQYGELTVICNMGTKCALHSLAKRFSLPVISYPYREDPFCIDNTMTQFVQELLKHKRRHPLFFRLKKLLAPRK